VKRPRTTRERTAWRKAQQRNRLGAALLNLQLRLGRINKPDLEVAELNKPKLMKTSSLIRRLHSLNAVKLAAKEERAGVRVGRKLYRPKVQAFMYDDQGRILAAKSQAAGSGLRAYSNYKFPGGGVEPGENIPEAARKELLEEAGYEAGGDLFEFGTPTPVDWDRKFRAQARKKGRGGYAGQYEYYAAGPIGKRNTSLLGSEGDALGGMEFVPIRALKRDLRKTSTDPNNEYGYFDTQKLVALKALEKELKQRGVKTASARLKQIALPPELVQFSNKYYQTHGQGRAINYGQERFDEYRRPRIKKERSLEEAYATKTSALLDADDLVKKAEKGVAQKSDPAEWARAKAQARAKMGGKHSARAMQLATQIYKKNGGGYRGAKPSSGTNKLKKWTKQDWQWSGKDTPGPGGTGVYLPKRSTDQLKSTDSGRDKLRAAAAAKRAATASGKQFSNHGLHVGRKRSDVR
jgi:8-oxo-dGTP pyrophosphatase MutT (NUDIX family)